MRQIDLVNIQPSGKYPCFIPYIPLPNTSKVEKLTGYNRTHTQSQMEELPPRFYVRKDFISCFTPEEDTMPSLN